MATPKEQNRFWSKVRQIRKLYSNGGQTHRSLAEMFGVSSPVITKVLNNEIWRHVT